MTSFDTRFFESEKNKDNDIINEIDEKMSKPILQPKKGNSQSFQNLHDKFYNDKNSRLTTIKSD